MTKKKRRFFPLSPKAGCRFILLIVVAIVGMIGVMVWAFANLLNPVGDAANALLTALKNRDTNAAYTMMSDEYQAVHTEQEFTSAILEYTPPPSDWQFSSFSVNGINGRVIGSVVIEGQRYNSLITMVYQNGAWAITGFDFGTPNDPDLIPLATATPAA
jgi:hypothetical protein